MELPPPTFTYHTEMRVFPCHPPSPACMQALPARQTLPSIWEALPEFFSPPQREFVDLVQTDSYGERQDQDRDRKSGILHQDLTQYNGFPSKFFPPDRREIIDLTQDYDDDEVEEDAMEGREEEKNNRKEEDHVTLEENMREGKAVFQSSITFSTAKAPTSSKPSALHTCKQCPKKYLRSSSLYAHFRLKHGDTSYKCRYCDRILTTSSSCTTHENNIHLEIRYNCQYCDYTSGDKGQRTQHEKNFHEAHWSCSHCDLSFAQKEARADHEKSIHKHRDIWSCPHCASNFLAQHLRDIHELTHPKNIYVGRKFGCSNCNRAFHHRVALLAHEEGCGNSTFTKVEQSYFGHRGAKEPDA